MEMIARVTIRGAKTWVGSMEGKNLDTAKIYVDVQLKGETSWGVCTDEIKCTDSKVVEAIKHNSFPFIAEITLEELSNGKATTKVCTGIKPLAREPGKEMPKAA
jgi:hypothetical protein